MLSTTSFPRASRRGGSALSSACRIARAELVAGLRDGRYDAAFTRPPLVDDLATRTLVTEPVCAVLPDGHPLATRAELRLGDLAREPWVLTSRDSWPPWHRRLAASARGLRRTGVVFVPLAGDRADTVAAWRPGTGGPALRNLLDVVTELAATTDLPRSG